MLHVTVIQIWGGKTIMKKTIKMLLVIGICLLLAGISKQTKAEQYPQEETVAGLTYELDEEDTGYLVTKWDGVSEEVTIPDELHGIPVRAVGSSVFQGRKLLRKITFGKNISSIYWKSFYGCSSLVEVHFGSNIREVEEDAFRECSNLQIITGGNHLKKIGTHAFADCQSLKEFHVPKDITYFGNGVFVGCTNLEKITASATPKNMIEISMDSFEGSKWYQQCITQKKTVIWNHVLIYAGGLHGNVTLSGKKYKGIALFAFKNCQDIKTITVKNIKYIHRVAFFYCSASQLKIVGQNSLSGFSLDMKSNIRKLTLDVKNIVGMESCPGVRTMILGKRISIFKPSNNYTLKECFKNLKTLKFSTPEDVMFSPSKWEFPTEKPYAYRQINNLRHIYLKSAKPSSSIKKQFSRRVTLHVPKKSIKIYKKYAKCKVVAR